jgi:PatG C-terminal
MEQTQQPTTAQSGENGGPFPSQQAATGVMPECGCGGAEGNSKSPQYVYVIGNLRPAYPSISVEKAFQWAVGAQGVNSADYTLQYQVMREAANIAVSKQVCWVMQVGRNANTGSADTYLVAPRSYSELYNMIGSIQPDQEQASRRYDVVIGPRGPIAPPEMCNGLQLPMLVCNQIYSFTFDEFVAAVVAKTAVAVEDIGSMFYQLMQLADNAGETDEHRALNYVTLRYPEIYVMAANMAGRGSGPYLIPGSIFTLQSIVAKLAPVQGARRIVDIVFHYTERQSNDSAYWYTEVDTTGQFPFLVRPLSRYYPHP